MYDIALISEVYSIEIEEIDQHISVSGSWLSLVEMQKIKNNYKFTSVCNSLIAYIRKRIRKKMLIFVQSGLGTVGLIREYEHPYNSITAGV